MASESRKTIRSVTAMEALLVVATAVQRCHSFVAQGYAECSCADGHRAHVVDCGNHAGIEQTSSIVEGKDNNVCASSSSGWPVNSIARLLQLL